MLGQISLLMEMFSKDREEWRHREQGEFAYPRRVFPEDLVQPGPSGYLPPRNPSRRDSYRRASGSPVGFERAPPRSFIRRDRSPVSGRSPLRRERVPSRTESAPPSFSPSFAPRGPVRSPFAPPQPAPRPPPPRTPRMERPRPRPSPVFQPAQPPPPRTPRMERPRPRLSPMSPAQSVIEDEHEEQEVEDEE